MSEELAVVYPRIDAALATVEEEVTILDAERAALERFRSRLQGLDSVVTTSATGGAGPASTTTVSGTAPADVRAAYRDTVLAMDHYEREYGEPLLVHAAVEFGPQIVGILAGDVPLSSMQLDVVEGAIEQGIEERRQFSREIDTERDSLETVRGRLGAIERGFYEHGRETGTGGSASATDCATATLPRLAKECEALATERQQAIRSGPVSAHAGVDEMRLTAYLYGDCEYRFPALAEIADVAEQITAAIDRATNDDPAADDELVGDDGGGRTH